jgi:hypothetical protein
MHVVLPWSISLIVVVHHQESPQGYLPVAEARQGPVLLATAVFHYPHTVRLRYQLPNKDRTARTRKTKKRIFATPMKELAMTPKPKMAAARAMTRHRMDKRNMIRFS